MTPSPRLGIRRLGKTIILVGVVIVFVLAALVDEALVRGDRFGYCPRDANWTFHGPNGGAFWRGLERTGAYAALEGSRPQPLQAIEREIHIRTGLRLTSWRWRLWMGRSFLAAGGEDSWGLCIRPGIMLRLLHVLRAPFAEAQDGIYTFDNMAYSWRDGFLLLSPHAEWVQAARSESAQHEFDSVPVKTMAQLTLPRSPRLALRVTAAEDLPVDGTLEARVSERNSPLMLHGALDNNTALVLHGSRVSDLATVARATTAHIPASLRDHPIWREYGALWSRWSLPEMGAGWDADTDEIALAVYPANGSVLPPVPEAAALWTGNLEGSEHPLAQLSHALGSVEHEWSGTRGSVAPLLGTALQLCTGERETGWVAASNEPLMADVASQSIETQPIDSDVAVRIHFDVVGSWLQESAELAGALGLIRGKGRDDMKVAWYPWLDALAHMGTAELTGEANGNTLRISGWLARGAGASNVP